jgi:DNA-binding CsgD family transcriptional regulator
MMAADGAQPDLSTPVSSKSVVCSSEDLAWLISDFATRSEAEAVVLSLHARGQDRSERIFSLGGHEISGEVLDAMMAVGAVTWPDRRSGENSPQANWGAHDLNGQRRLLLAMPLAVRGGSRLVLTALFDLDPDDDARDVPERAVSDLHPILAPYLRLWLAHRHQSRRLSGMATALDATDIATYLIDAGGNLLFANACGERLISDGDGLRRAGTALAATDMSDTVKLRVALDHVVSLASAGGAAPGKATIVPLRRGDERRPLVAVVMGAAALPGGPDDPAAIVQVFNPETDVGQFLLPICQLYGLSPSETRLVALLAEGVSVNEAAERMRVKVPTLRTYLKQIFAKTQTSRQSDLIRLMMGSMIRTRSPEGFRTL